MAKERWSIWKVIGASSAGTLIEWYDFYIFGALATTLSSAFFPKGNPTISLLSTLATFATGFIVRPFGAIFFGRLGDVIGRKHTFLVTLILMGAATFAIGLLPTYTQIGVFAPILLVLLRLLQGLALGGEYGGAAIYVAEHSPPERRGFYTSFIQTTATLGLFVSLGVILAVTTSMEKAAFDLWGWRIPFLLSSLLVIFSYFIRKRMAESPLFAELKASGKTSQNPLKESFLNPANRKLVLLALFGATAGQGVVWYTGQFYALYFLQTVMKIEKSLASQVIAAALLIGTPFFVVFGALSDRIGRKKIIVAGCAVAAVCYVPIYMAKYNLIQPERWQPIASPEIKLERAIDPVTQEASIRRSTLTQYEQGRVAETVTTKLNPGPEDEPEVRTEITPRFSFNAVLVLLIAVQVLFVTMVYGPIAAFLVELFPTRIRYTSLSVPYHIGNGVFGGLVPFISTALERGTGNPYAGLGYPILVALVTATIGGFMLREPKPEGIAEEP